MIKKSKGLTPLKVTLPIAPQPPGLGKTFLGIHLQTALQTRGKQPCELEDKIAEDIRKTVGSLIIPVAKVKEMQKANPMYIVKQMLLAEFPLDGATVMEAFENASRVLVDFYDLQSGCITFEEAFCRLIVDAACEQLHAPRPAPATFNVVQDTTKWLLSVRTSIYLILDDFPIIFGTAYFSESQGDELTAALKEFSRCTGILFRHPNVFLYCTGRTATGCFLAHNFAGSLFWGKVTLQPLSQQDILEILVNTKRGGRALYEAAGFSAAELPELAACIYKSTGGVGRLLLHVCDNVVKLRGMSVRECVEARRSMALRDASSVVSGGIEEAFYAMG
jgi:hypothetical protein